MHAHMCYSIRGSSSFPWLLFLWLTALAGRLQVVRCGQQHPSSPMGNLHRSRLRPSSSTDTQLQFMEPYHLGNFAYVERPKAVGPFQRFLECPVIEKLQTFFLGVRDDHRKRGFVYLLARGLRLCVVWWCTKDVFVTLFEDRYEAERDPEKFFKEGLWLSKSHKQTVKRRTQRGQRNRLWAGLGDTPRDICLTGILMRGTFRCTALSKVFEPTLTGWGAGTMLAAKFSKVEWIPCYLIGWFVSEYYWRIAFDVNGPPRPEDSGFEGIPVFIKHVRDIRLF